MGLSLHCVSSDVRIKDGVVVSGPSYLIAVTVTCGEDPDGGKVKVLDCDDAGDVVGAKVLAYVTTKDLGPTKSFCPALPIRADNGLYLSEMSSNSEVVIQYFSEIGNPLIP